MIKLKRREQKKKEEEIEEIINRLEGKPGFC